MTAVCLRRLVTVYYSSFTECTDNDVMSEVCKYIFLTGWLETSTEKIYVHFLNI